MKALIALTLTALTLSLATDNFELKPYQFKEYERYIYNYREVFKGFKNKGRFEILMKRIGEEYEVTIGGRYREWEGIVSERFKDANEIAGFVLMKSYFDHHWLIPLTRTLFSKALVKVLSAKNLDLSTGIKKIDENTMRVVRKCKVGGLSGKMIEIIKGKEVVFRLCLSPYASLPTYVYKKSEEGNLYEMKLLEYSDLK